MRKLSESTMATWIARRCSGRTMAYAVYKWNSEEQTAIVVTRTASGPVSRFCTPSSRSIISSARASASALTSFAGWCSLATSSVIAPLRKKKPRLARGFIRSFSFLLFELDALLGEVLYRTRMPWNRRGICLLVLHRDVLRLFVRANQLVALVEERLDDVIGRLVVHALVRDEQVVHRGDLVVGVHPLVDVLGDGVLDVQVAVLLVHFRHCVAVIDQLDLHARCAGEVGDGRGGQAADPEEGVDLAVLQGVGRFGDAEALTLHVLVLVEPRSLDDAKRHHLGSAAAGARRDPLAFQIGHFCDAGALDGHHVHAVRIED